MDESQPLLRQITNTSLEPRHPTVNDPRVDFDPNGDPDNPLDWPKAYKLGVISLLASMAFTVYSEPKQIRCFHRVANFCLGRSRVLASCRLPTELCSI